MADKIGHPHDRKNRVETYHEEHRLKSVSNVKIEELQIVLNRPMRCCTDSQQGVVATQGPRVLHCLSSLK